MTRDIFIIGLYAIVLFYLTQPGMRTAFEGGTTIGSAHG